MTRILKTHKNRAYHFSRFEFFSGYGIVAIGKCGPGKQISWPEFFCQAGSPYVY